MQVLILILLLFSFSVPGDEVGKSQVFQIKGDLFTPAIGNEIKTWNFPVSNKKTFQKIVVDLDVTVGDWWQNNPDGLHNIFWLTRQGIWKSNTIGYVNLFGPHRNMLKQMTNLDLAKGKAQSKTAEFIAEKGHTYHITYTFNCKTGFITTEIKEQDIRKVSIQMPVTTSEIQAKGEFFQLWIGLNEKYNECPTIGWSYSNLLITMVSDSAQNRMPAKGPLRVHGINPRYFDDGTGRALLLVGVNHGWELQDNAWNIPYTLNWPAYLNYLKKYKLNYLRLWRVESTSGTDNPSFLTEPMPYLRSGPGQAQDNQLKFDLTRFNQLYFDRIRKRCIDAGRLGIYVNIMFFEKHSTFNQKISGGSDYPWKGHPFFSQNNINGINPDIDGDGCPREIHFLPQTNYTTAQMEMAKKVLDLQESYIKKVIDTVNDLDNILFEICNEALPDPKTDHWQKYMVDFVKEYELTKSKQHVIGFTGPSRETHADRWPELLDQLNSNADFVSPRNAEEYRTSPPKAEGGKVIFADSDHINPYGRDFIWVWKSFTRGLHPQALEAYDIIDPKTPGIDLFRDRLVRLNLGYCLDFACRMDLSLMTPRNELASTTYCLANPGSEYLVFSPDSGAFTVNVTSVSDSMEVEWLQIETGERFNGGSIPGKAYRSFHPPFLGPAVLYLKAQINT